MAIEIATAIAIATATANAIDCGWPIEGVGWMAG